MRLCKMRGVKRGATVVRHLRRTLETMNNVTPTHETSSVKILKIFSSLPSKYEFGKDSTKQMKYRNPRNLQFKS